MSGSAGTVRNLAFGHSSSVQLTLVVDGTRHELSQIGPGYVVLRQGCELPKADAEIIVSVDGNVRRWPVHLSNGAVPFDRTAVIVDR